MTRRGFLGAAAGSAALLGLAACGAAGTGAASGNAGLAARQVDSVNGPIAVPARPARVVTLDDFSMAAMFDLGMDPVGVYSAGEQYVQPQFLAKWRTIAKISGGTIGGAVDLEKVAACKPDLILGIDAQKSPYDQLTALAPTVIMPFAASKVAWRDMTEDTATAVGRTDALQALRSRYASRTAEIKSRYAGVLAVSRWDVLQGGFDQGQYWLYGPASPIGTILADAGVRFASGSAATTAPTGQRALSYERIDALADADAVFYYTTNDGKPANLGPQLFAQQAFTQLSAARQRHLFGSIHFLPGGYSDALGALDALETALETALKSL
ncbi:iron ABC transporter substrate-binding protein [Rugosimonospora africana]|uniref:Iron ABC transporter substrate-binding protein n=1 Tax=Rugosimonospora africana TaxID=556532 RepID=A0A8J3R1Y9_9ACTN|nr:iron ABC transporter substrate-binding protein [Rugosimonospora africana]